VTLLATDDDAETTPGGQVKYRFRTGSEDHFDIDQLTGVVTVAVGDNDDNENELSYVDQPRYNITVYH